MRFSNCYKAVQLSGFFWNQRLLRYGCRWCGWGSALGSKSTLRHYLLKLSDGMFGFRGFSRRYKLRFNKTKNFSLFLLNYTTPFLPVTSPWTWYMLLNLQIKNYVSYRYKLSLPTRGQRSRTNRQTVKNTKDLVTQKLLNDFNQPIFGYRKRKVVFIKKSTKGAKSRSSKTTPKVGAKGSKKTIRTKKKDIWR